MPESAGTPQPTERPVESAAALVAAVWRAAAAARWEPGQPPASVGGPHVAGPFRAVLRALATQADALNGGSPGGARAARLLAETARAVDAVLHEHEPSGAPAAAASNGHERADGLAPAAHLRLARMERWLAARAATDPDAGPAADLCLFVLEHLEADGPPGLPGPGLPTTP